MAQQILNKHLLGFLMNKTGAGYRSVAQHVLSMQKAIGSIPAPKKNRGTGVGCFTHVMTEIDQSVRF